MRQEGVGGHGRERTERGTVRRGGQLHRDVLTLTFAQGVMNPAQDLLGRVSERLARPLSGGALHGRLQTAGVEGEVVGGPFGKVQTHHGHVVARKFG